MLPRKKRLIPKAFLPIGTATVVLMCFVGTARAVQFGGEFMTDWTGCECGASGLSHTDDQIAQWAGTMNSLGHQQLFPIYGNQDAWACDITEDGLGGCDWQIGDAVEIYAFAGHGGGGNDSQGHQTFTVPYCYAAGVPSGCTFDSANARWGERSGPYSSPYPGNMRWALFLTCYSVDTDPYNQWNEVFDLGFDYVLGYRGTSCDSSTTEEVPSDWANSAFGNSSNFISSWFSAIEDWYCDDTGAVAAGGISADSASARRDFTSKFVGRRPAGEHHTWIYWAWHSG